MIIYKKEMTEIDVLDTLICDKCGIKIDTDIDFIETQEAYSICFVGGYGSVFGDMSEVQCDLCQRCLKELIGEFCRFPQEEKEGG